jgi:hypothetical protein
MNWRSFHSVMKTVRELCFDGLLPVLSDLNAVVSERFITGLLARIA